VYGLGLDNPKLLSKIWRDSQSQRSGSNSGTDQPIYQVLEQNFIRALYTTVPASVTGCLLILFLVNRVPRVRFMVVMFIILAVILGITGGSLFSVYETGEHGVTVAFYAISLFLMNVGPNTITFMLPSELFPTKHRGACYGIAAASGKLGAITIQCILWKVKAGGPEKQNLAIPLLVFAPLMLFGALVAWIWIPEVQDPSENNQDRHKLKQYSKYINRSLEEIADDPTGEQELGIHAKFGGLFRFRKR